MSRMVFDKLQYILYYMVIKQLKKVIIMKHYMLQHHSTNNLMGVKPRIYDENTVKAVFRNKVHSPDEWFLLSVYFDNTPTPHNYGTIVRNRTNGEYLCGSISTGKNYLSKVRSPRRYVTFNSAVKGIHMSDLAYNDFEILYIKDKPTFAIPGIG